MSTESTTAVSLLARLSAGETSSEEVVRSLLDRSKRAEKLNVFVHLDPEGVLAQARAIDARRKNGEMVGRLAGVPVAIKDVFVRRGRTDDLRQPHAAELSASL